MMKTLGAAALLLPATLSAQEGVIRYDRAVRYDFEIPENYPDELRNEIPMQDISSVMLFFSGTESLMLLAPDGEQETEMDAETAERSLRANAMAERLRNQSVSRSDQEVLLDTYVRFADESTVEARELIGRKFLIRDTRPAYAWRLTGEQSTFLDYPVYRATATHGESEIEAWFTPDIPIPAGPGEFGGLPGMILVVSVDDGHTVYSATELDLRAVDEGVIRSPEEGDEVSREEYERIVEEKLEELRMVRGRRR